MGRGTGAPSAGRVRGAPYTMRNPTVRTMYYTVFISLSILLLPHWFLCSLDVWRAVLPEPLPRGERGGDWKPKAGRKEASFP